MFPSSPGRRLCVLVDAGPTPCALDALAVREVLPEGEAAPVASPRGLLELLGGVADGAPGLCLVMDAQPAFSLAVQRVRGVVDVSGAQSFQLPQGVAPAVARVASGALLLEGQVYLELDAKRLASAEPELSRAVAPVRDDASAGPPGRVLVFRCSGEAWAVPLGSVVRVADTHGLCPTPGRTAGLLVSGGALWPAVSLGGGSGLTAVFLEHEGRPLALLVDEVLGIHDSPRTAGSEGGVSRLALGPLFA